MPQRRNPGSQGPPLLQYGQGASYLQEEGIDEDPEVMEGLLAANRIIALSQGKTPPGRNSNYRGIWYDYTDFIRDLLLIGAASQIARTSKIGDRHSNRKYAARHAFDEELSGYGERAFRFLAENDGELHRERK